MPSNLVVSSVMVRRTLLVFSIIALLFIVKVPNLPFIVMELSTSVPKTVSPLISVMSAIRASVVDVVLSIFAPLPNSKLSPVIVRSPPIVASPVV